MDFLARLSNFEAILVDEVAQATLTAVNMDCVEPFAALGVLPVAQNLIKRSSYVIQVCEHTLLYHMWCRNQGELFWKSRRHFIKVETASEVIPIFSVVLCRLLLIPAGYGHSKIESREFVSCWEPKRCVF